MATLNDLYLRARLEDRREKLASAIVGSSQPEQLARLLEQVDSALDRMEKGNFGICDICHEEIGQERILQDPFARVCLDHLSRQQREALEEDLQLAARVQRALLPPPTFRSDGWQVHYQYEPAGTVSGDYCDLVQPEKGGDLFFALGDVSGKGVAASMLMAQLHAMFRSLASVNLPLEQMVERANRLLCESAVAGQFATLVCGRAGRAGEIEVSIAGHPPILLTQNGDVASVEATGLPLGMFSNGNFDVRKVKLEPGDSLVLYTDGISEAFSRTGAEYGIGRLTELIGRLHNLSPAALVAACLEDVKQHSAAAPQADDRTIMVLRRAA